MGGTTGWVYRISEWVMRIAYLNLLWILATLLGLIIFGVMPATVAMFSVIRKWIMKESDIPIFRTFVTVYKQEFLKTNLFGLIFSIIGYFLHFNLMFLENLSGIFQIVYMIGLFTIAMIYFITLLFIVPVYVHFNLRFLQYFRTSFIIGVINPLMLGFMIIGLILLNSIFFIIPRLIPFFGVSVCGLLIMWLAFKSFKRLEEKKIIFN